MTQSIACSIAKQWADRIKLAEIRRNIPQSWTKWTKYTVKVHTHGRKLRTYACGFSALMRQRASKSADSQMRCFISNCCLCWCWRKAWITTLTGAPLCVVRATVGRFLQSHWWLR